MAVKPFILFVSNPIGQLVCSVVTVSFDNLRFVMLTGCWNVLTVTRYVGESVKL